MTTKTRRPRGSKAQTRQDLIDAAVKIIRKQGVAGLSTVSVTGEAGLAQSGFYAHFKSMDGCLQAAAKHIAEMIRSSVSQSRKKLYAESLGSHQATVAFCDSMVTLFLEEKHMTEILLRNQADRSPLGRSMRRVMTSIREDLAGDLWLVGLGLGLQERHRKRVELLAEFIIGSVNAAVLALIDGRLKDPALVASELACTAGAASSDLVRRCLAEECRS